MYCLLYFKMCLVKVTLILLKVFLSSNTKVLFIYIVVTYLKLFSDWCTGNFVESDVSNAGNGKQRPAAGTRCVIPCHWEAGRWGSSWCYTSLDKSQWGAECLPCTGKIISLLASQIIQKKIIMF